MGVIHVMDSHLSNMIAAGEVVDRPVNIVKECVENALDAGAQSIEIEIYEGGIEGVIVTDDGCGMDSEDALLAFSRHATSKLQDENDLFNIQTMGFRGEALASIAAVAKVDLQTNNGKEGSHVRFEYGELTDQEVYSCPRGTRIEVRGLFVRTPARFKYLKKANYEFSIIADMVNKLAIANPGIRISLRHNDRLVFQTSGKGNQKEIFYQMFGREVAENAEEFSAQTDDFVIEGLAVQPKVTRANKNYIYLSINDRLVRSFPIQKAILEGYSEYLPKDRYPIFYMNVQVDPQLVDVNVHPNKLEVRLSKEEYLVQLIINTIENLFSSQLQTPEIQLAKNMPAPIQGEMKLQYPHPVGQQTRNQAGRDASDFKGQKSMEIRQASDAWNAPNDTGREMAAFPMAGTAKTNTEKNGGNTEWEKIADVKGNPHFDNYEAGNRRLSQEYETRYEVPEKSRNDELRELFHGSIPDAARTAGVHALSQDSPAETLETGDGETAAPTKAAVQTETADPQSLQESLDLDEISYPIPVSSRKEQEERGKEFFSHLRIIGQLKDSYILCENGSGLVIIDQHAAQERYNFERISREFEQPVRMLQPRMIPMRIPVSADVFVQVEKINSFTEYYGLHFEPFGTNQLILRMEPDWFSLVEPEEFLNDMLAYFKQNDEIDMAALRRHLIATMACHSSVRFHHKLNMQEMEKVISDLMKCEQPYHCPHGRPTVITLSDAMLRKEFERG